MTERPADGGEISMVATVAAVLTELDSSFTLKDKKNWMFFSKQHFWGVFFFFTSGLNQQ